MALKLVVVSTAKNTDQILARLSQSSDLDVVLHFGRRTADLMASSISRMAPKHGRRGHLAEGDSFAGAALEDSLGEDHYRHVFHFIDHYMRRDPTFNMRPHKLKNVHDYIDFYHILTDMVTERLRRSGAEAALFFNIPHLTYDSVVYQAAGRLGLKRLIVTQTLFPNRFASLSRAEDYGYLDIPEAPEEPPMEIEREADLDLFYMPEMKAKKGKGRLTAQNIAHLAHYIVKREPLSLLRPGRISALISRMRATKRPFPDWRDPYARFFHTDQFAYLEKLAGFEEREVDFEARYVYVPLQLQPEMTTSALGGRFVDQALAIEHLARMLPKGVKIYVKENPKQGSFMRGPLFFQRLCRIEAVEILPSHTDTTALTQNAEFVAAITGTAGWEAIRKGKRALIFGNAWYGSLPGVCRFSPGLRYDDVLAVPLEHEALEAAAGYLLSRLHEGVVDRHYTKIVENFDAAANAQTCAETIRRLLMGEAALTFSGGQASWRAIDGAK